jgi:putative DNA primase/helicase
MNSLANSSVVNKSGQDGLSEFKRRVLECPALSNEAWCKWIKDPAVTDDAARQYLADKYPDALAYALEIPATEAQPGVSPSMDLSPADILRVLLPSTGIYCCTRIEDISGKARARNLPFDTVEEVAARAFALDAQGIDAYMAMSSFTDRERVRAKDGKRYFPRTADNAAAMHSFWLDIDAGEGKPYADQNAARQALNAFVQTTRLPVPWVIGSGGGLHVYWPVDSDMTPSDWKPHAEGLKALCNQHNLLADHSRTTDAASILRVPGTHNHKRPADPRPVKLLQRGGVTPVGELLTILPAETQAAAKVTRAHVMAADDPMFAAMPQHVRDLPAPPPDPNRPSATLIARGCKQIQYAGLGPEPVWHRMITVLHTCKGGAKAIHALSALDTRRYDKDDTDRKIEHVAATAGPTGMPATCRTFNDLNPGVCTSCPHWQRITSPIELGRAAPEQPSIVGRPNAANDANAPSTNERGDWPVPTPLPNALPPVQPFSYDLLPDVLRPWVADVAERMQCPPDFVAVGTAVALSSLAARCYAVCPKAKDNWQVVPNMWGMAVGRPGAAKSPALNSAMFHLYHLQAQERQRYQDAHAKWSVDAAVAQLQNKDRKKQAADVANKNPDEARRLLESVGTADEPVERRFFVNDTTVEKMGELLRDNPGGFCVFRDELYGLLTSLDKQGQEGSRTFYLQGYDGDKPYTVDRILRGTVHVPRLCLSMLGGIQPGRVHEYVRAAVSGGSGDDGLTQRFGLAVWPDTSRDFVDIDQSPDSPAYQAVQAVFVRLSQVLPMPDGKLNILRFDPAAQLVFRSWREKHMRELHRKELHPALESHLMKYNKLVPSLALIFALVDTPGMKAIGERELRRAIAWADYLRTHAERLYSAAGTKQLIFFVHRL